MLQLITACARRQVERITKCFYTVFHYCHTTAVKLSKWRAVNKYTVGQKTGLFLELRNSRIC